MHLQKQQWDTLEMLEEAIRFLFSHPRLAEAPRILIQGSMLVAEASVLSRWPCFTSDSDEGDSDECSARPSTAAAGGGDCPSAKLCSSLLRLISLALTITKAAARYSDSSGPLSRAPLELWKACSSAVRLFGLPQRMHAARGLTALLLLPACFGIQRTIRMVSAREGVRIAAALSEDAVSSLLTLVLSCSDGLPPRLTVGVMMAAPALSLVEQESGRLPQIPGSSLGSGHQLDAGTTVGTTAGTTAGTTMGTTAGTTADVAASNAGSDTAGSDGSEDDDDFDGLAEAAASYISSLTMSLAASVVFNVPPLTRRTLHLWSSMVLDPGCCREGYSLHGNGPFFSAVFQSEAHGDPATATPELSEESVAALSHILSSPTWDRVLGYNTSYEAAAAGDWTLYNIICGLCCAASILELHPAVRQYSHTGSHTLGSSLSDDNFTQCAASPASTVSAPLSGSAWREARHSIAEALRLISDPADYSLSALAAVLSSALGWIREVMSGIISKAAATGGGSLGAAESVAVAGQSSDGLSLGLGSRDWECVQCELLLGLPEELWGVRPCCNTACVRLEGPCEMEVKTRACGGGCGARYCCVACQEQAWRGGHRRNCAAMREMREQWERDRAAMREMRGKERGR